MHVVLPLLTALVWATLATSARLQLALYVAAGLAWLALVVLSRRDSYAPRAVAIVALALALRVPAWLSPPQHSDDVYRYLWDGRVQQAGLNPYLEPPDSPSLAHLREPDHARINHADLRTIYPPLAQHAFRAARALPVTPLAGWKALVALADLATLLLLLRRSRVAALAWAASPLVVIELAADAHVDAVGIAFLTAALVTLRPALQGALVAAAAAVKLLPLALLGAQRRPAAFAAAALTLLLAAAPFLDAGARIAGSLGEYSRRWRGNDGAYALVHGLAVRGVARTRFAGRTSLPEHPRLVRALTGRDRDEIYPDEAAAVVARGCTLALWLVVFAVAVARRFDIARLALVAFGGWALLTPTLHPWYLAWLIPPLALAPTSLAWPLLVALAPLAHAPRLAFAETGAWTTPVWAAVALHAPVWLVLPWAPLTLPAGGDKIARSRDLVIE